MTKENSQTILIIILLGTFTLVELLYIAPEYKWGLKQVYELLITIFN